MTGKLYSVLRTSYRWDVAVADYSSTADLDDMNGCALVSSTEYALRHVSI
jgi:hypothetical protein